MLRKADKMLRITQLKLALPHGEAQIKAAIKKALHLNADSFSYKIKKESIDARKKPKLYTVYTVDVKLFCGISEKKVLQGCKNKNVAAVKEKKYSFPKSGEKELRHRPVIVGMGPAGLFCGLMLARAGYKPIILERGQDVKTRQEDVERFWAGGQLNPESNVQFGEGGAGTFSDGKLNTLVKDTSGRNVKVLEEFVKAGAPEHILYKNKPHIGTNVLKTIVEHMRQEMLSYGAQVRFGAKVTDICIKKGRQDAAGELEGLIINQKELLKTDVAVFAIGHSARDTFSMLHEKKISMQAKAFAVGVRVEHPQAQINLSQYGVEKAEYLEAAAYKLTAKAKDDRGVYSFCMCPGGYVVNASSEEGFLAVNGMSYSDRAGSNANSALVVTVGPEDFPSKDALSGIAFQRELEKAAFLEGKGKIPIQLYKDFKENRASTAYEGVEPQMKGQYCFANLRAVFPDYIGKALEDGMEQFGQKIKGFDREDCLFSGVESRTSSPVRIERGAQFECAVKGLYPCGEGAGYAGGITSAGMDGIKVAEAIAKKYKVL